MTKRPNLLVILGAALFLVGGAIETSWCCAAPGRQQQRRQLPASAGAWCRSSWPHHQPLGRPVRRTAPPLAAGDLIVVRQVPLAQRSAGAIAATSTDALSGQTIVAVAVHASGSQVPLSRP